MTDRVDDAIDRYLNEMSWAMGGSLEQQQAARDELRAHIRAEALDLELHGVDRETAVTQALQDLGDPSTVGLEMRTSLRRGVLRRPLRQPDGALGFGVRRARNLPPLGVLFALFGAMVMAGVVAFLYVWPV